MSDSPLPLNSRQHQTSSPDRVSKSSGEIPDREQVSLSSNLDPESQIQQQSPKQKDMDQDRKSSHHHGSSRIHELLNSFKDDVIQLKDTGPQSTSTHPHHHAFNQPEDYNRQFTRVSPQNVSATTATRDKARSKWKKAVTMSRSVIARRRESSASGRRPARSGSFSADFSLNDDFESNLKMNVLLNVFNHASCIGSGILSGLLLWDAIWVYQHGKDWQPSEKSLLFFYTVTTVLMYICLIGYKLRLYTFCHRFELSTLGHAIIILAILILHYVHKSYDFKMIECRSYDAESKEALELHCSTGKYTNVLIVLSKMTQTLSTFFLAVYFHFAPYVSLDLLLRSSQSQIKSIHLLSRTRDFS